MGSLLSHPSLWQDASRADEYAPHFGHWLRSGRGFPGADFIRTFEQARERVPESWLRAVAEEWLLAASCGETERVPDFLKSVPPFPGAPAWEQLVRCQCAPAVIPLDCRPQGAMARVWVFRDPKGRVSGAADPRFDRPALKLDSTFGIAVAGYPADKISGDSWQLAAWLAARAIQENRTDLLRRLASEWLVTGRISGSEEPLTVDRVTLGTKVCLVENQRDGERSWLLPAANEQPLEEPYQTLALTAVGRVHFARTTADAWSHLSGEGVVWTSDQNWPEPCAGVHGFVSNALGPFLAIILKSLPCPVVLWTTPRMTTLARDLRTALRRVLAACQYSDPVDVTIHKVPDASHREANSAGESRDLLSATERVLAQSPALRERNGPRIVFNNTGGNFLHRTAAVRRAALNSRIWLAYRDINDCETPHFSLLRHELGQTLSGRLLLTPRPVGTRGIQWQALVDHRDATRGQLDEVASRARVEGLVTAALG